MKKTFTKIMLLLFALVVGIGNAMSQSDPYYTLDTEASGNTSSNNSYTGTGSVTVDGIKWYVMGNSGIQPWRLGGKASTTSTTATLVVNRPVYTDDEMDEKIESIKLYIGDVTVNTFTSVTLTVASTTSFSGDDIIDEITNSSPSANSTLTFTPTSGSYWDEDSFYKFTITATLKGKSNTYVQFKKVEFFEYTSGGSAPTVTISGTDISNNAASFAYNNTSNHTATVTCSNFASTPTPTIDIYTDAVCSTVYNGSAFTAAFAQNSTTTVNYAFTNANPSTSSPRTFYMRATADGVNSNVVAVSQAASPTLYSVTFNPDEGIFVPNATFTSNQMSLEAGDYTLPSATKDGYLFVSWKDGNDNNEYYAGASYTLSGNVTLTAQWEELDYNNTYTSGEGLLSTTGGTNASLCKVKIYNVEYDGIKAGKSNEAGAWKVTVPENTTKLHLHLAGWNDENVTLSVTPSGYSNGITLTANSGISGSGSTYTFSGDPSTDSYYKIITFADPLEEAVTLTFTATGGNRFVVWGVNAEMSTDPYITAEDVDIDDDVTAGSITYTVHNIPEPAGVLSASVKTGDWLTLGSVSSNVPFTCAVNPNPTERTATVTLTYTYGDSKTTTLDVTVTQAPKVVTYTYTLATSIESGKHYIITDGGTKIMGSQSGNNRTAVDISEEGYYDNVNNKYSIPTNADGIREFVINGPNVITKGNNSIEVYTIYDAAQPGYLYCSSSDSKSYLRSRTFSGQTDNLEKWTITFSEGASVITSVGRNNRNIIQLNSTLFNCYTSGYDDIYLYVKNNDTNYEFYKDIAAHTDATGAGYTDGWYFIASPVNSNNMTPASVTNMIAETAANYDLYRLSGNTLENYQNQGTTNFVIANGVGYLYSNAANTTLKFSGSSVKAYSTDDNTVTPSHSGWNLIGNPYTFPVEVSRAFSELNNGSAVNSMDANSIINPGAGIIVYGTEDVTFTKYEPTAQSSGPSNINIMLAQQVASRDGSSTTSVNIDNAIVSFNSNSRLPKFTLLEGNAKLYIPQNGEDYAIAFSNRQGDMPLNFKTTETGNYTISFEGNNMNLRGIYLIDMLAGQEIDLSVNPSYTFIGSPVDKAERFKIVFKNVGSNGEDIFAYQNGNDIIVSGEGELQIFDVTGRSVMTTTISGVETINVPTMGVYIFRLIGSEIKTQKIVVR